MKEYILPILLSACSLSASAQVYQDPAFPGGTDSLLRFIQRHTAIPATGTLTAEGITAGAQLIVDRKGKISFVSTLPISLTDPFSRALVHMIKKMPSWEPGLIGGKKTFTQYAVGGRFYLKPDGNTGQPAFTVDMPPHFPGGEPGMDHFLNNTVKYPADALENGVSGTVTVAVTIKEDGSTDNVRITGPALGHGLEEEAIRVALLMPKWEPAVKEGKRVTAEHSFPLKFTLR